MVLFAQYIFSFLTVDCIMVSLVKMYPHVHRDLIRLFLDRGVQTSGTFLPLKGGTAVSDDRSVS